MQKVYPKKTPRIPFTQAGYDNMLAEKAKYMAERPDAVEHLRKAREMGDLSENGYYKASRQRLSFIDAQLRKLDRLVALGVVVASTQSDRVEIGSRVKLTDGKKDVEYTVVGGYESDPANRTISYRSPLGSALMGKKIHDVISVHAPAGVIQYTLVAIL